MARSISAVDILDLDNLVDYVVNSDSFVEAIGELRDDQIRGLVEEEIGNLDLSDQIKDAVLEEMPDIDGLRTDIECWMDEDAIVKLSESVANTTDDLLRLIKGLQEQNQTLFTALGEAERKIEKLEQSHNRSGRYFWNLVKRLRQFPFGKTLFDDFTIGKR